MSPNKFMDRLEKQDTRFCEAFPTENRVAIAFRSSNQRCSMKKGVLTNVTKFKGKHLCQSLFFNKAAGLRPATSLKKRLWHRVFL